MHAHSCTTNTMLTGQRYQCCWVCAYVVYQMVCSSWYSKYIIFIRNAHCSVSWQCCTCASPTNCSSEIIQCLISTCICAQRGLSMPSVPYISRECIMTFLQRRRFVNARVRWDWFQCVWDRDYHSDYWSWLLACDWSSLGKVERNLLQMRFAWIPDSGICVKPSHKVKKRWKRKY